MSQAGWRPLFFCECELCICFLAFHPVHRGWGIALTDAINEMDPSSILNHPFLEVGGPVCGRGGWTLMIIGLPSKPSHSIFHLVFMLFSAI